jgi:hypothetical protein
VVRTRISISLICVVIALASAGCNPGIVDVPQPQVTNAAAYFFSKNSGPVTFKELDTAAGSAQVKNIFTLTASPDSGDTFFLNETSGSYTDRLICTIGAEAVSVSGISQHSIIPLPDGYSIKPKRSQISYSYTPPIDHLIAVSNGIFASSGASIYCSTDNGGSWRLCGSLSAEDAITAFTSFEDNVYAGTKLGRIYSSSDWTHPIKQFGKEITAFASVPDMKRLYVAYGDSIIYFDQTLSSRNGVPANKVKVTSLAYMTDTINVLIAGTPGNGLFYLEDGGDWKPVGSNYISSSDSITSIISVAKHVFCSTNKGVYSSDGFLSSWLPRDVLTNAYLAYDTKKIIAISRQGVTDGFTADNSTKGVRIGTMTGRSVYDLSATSSSHYYAATDYGVYQLFNGTQWSPSSTGISATKDSIIETPGDVVLLRSRSGNVSLDSSWEAGTVLLKSGLAFPITAQIVSNINNGVVMPDSTKYENVIEVQYSLGLAGTLGIPYWQIYYALDKGPIIIREIEEAKVSRKIYRYK